MSLSSEPEQGGHESVGYEPFNMESFDEPSSISDSQGGHYAFEALLDENSSGPSFESMMADSIQGAQKVLDNAKKIVSEAKSRAASIEQEAYEKGFAQGERDGKEMGGKKLEKLLENIQKVLGEMVDYKEKFIGLHEKEMLDLICKIAGKLVHNRVLIDKSIVRENIFQAFRLCSDRSEITVKVSPEDVEYVKDMRPEFFEHFKDIKSVTIESAPNIMPGGCQIETAFGLVDGGIDSQLEKIAASLKEASEN